MPSPLVLAKLFVPQVRRNLVSRPRLAASPGARLNVVSAPAGFGKTTLITGWADAAVSAGRPVAWLSLEHGDQNPATFWQYVAAALENAVPGAGAKALTLLSAQGVPVATALATLLNDLQSVPGGVRLILDDYHLADCPAIADDVAYFIDHLPPQVDLTISTRADPALPLPRLRARGELAEVRASDLRFTHDEAAAYANDIICLNLDDGDLAILEDRTEGWIAALQLAGLSLRGRDDVAAFIAGFAGDDRYVLDYLVEEVLSRQPEDVRRFLIHTSILDQLNGPLCDAVTKGKQSRSMLAMLDRSNMFVVPLDESRTQYRYHHLFADVLRTRLGDEQTDDVAALHQRAGRWFAQADDAVTAVRHFLKGGDIEGAADVIERHATALLRDRREATVRGWIADIPVDQVERRPMLALGFIGALMSSGDFGSVEERLDALEAVLASAGGSPAVTLVVSDQAEFARLPGAMEMYRAALALVRGDLSATAEHANKAAAAAADGDHLTVSAASALSGLAAWTAGDLEDACQQYSIAVNGLRSAGNISDVLGCSITLADIKITQGRLGDARRTFEQALTIAANHSPNTVLRGTADMYVGLGQIAFERNDLAATEEYLTRAESLGDTLGLPQFPYRRRVGRAQLAAASGDLDTAALLLQEAERVYAGDFSPNVRPIPAMRARLALSQGVDEEAAAWARNSGRTVDDDPSYVCEYEHVTLAQVLLHRAKEPADLRAAVRLLETLLTCAEDGGRTGSTIEILVALALAHHAQYGRRDLPATLALLERALRLAEPEGYVRTILKHGTAVAPLLEELVRRHGSWDYPRRLLGYLEHTKSPPGLPTHPSLVDQLSAREIDVLCLLAGDLTGPSIAQELVVSLNTVRTHTKNIYTKLGTHSRRAAVSRARELGLIPSTHAR